jgi:hypothetical protein
MKNRMVENCPVCDPINSLLDRLMLKDFKIVEAKLEDYHFHQLYFAVQGNLTILDKIESKDFTQKENKFICLCHWSTIELIQS